MQSLLYKRAQHGPLPAIFDVFKKSLTFRDNLEVAQPIRKAVEMIFNSEVPIEDTVIEVLEEMAMISEEVY